MRKKKEGLEYLPITGVRSDFKHFMNKYLEYNTVRYEQFVEVWRDKNMVYLCAGRATDREAREFVERVLQIAQEYFLPPYQFQVRVGGLYLLYAIYQIQPLSPKVKVRLTPSQWQETMYFQQQAAQQNHLDVVYVFQLMLQEQAFLFCYTPSEMSIHSSTKDSDEMTDDLADTLKEEKTALTSLFHYESLEKLSYLQDQYQQMKIGLAGPQATKPDKSLDVVLTELVEDVVVLLQSFKDKVSTFSRHGQKLEATKNDDEPMPETTGNRRQMLKTQAYSQLGVQTNKRQSLQAVSSSSTSPGKTVQLGSGEASHGAQKDLLSSVSDSTHRPASSTRHVDLADTLCSGHDNDEYIPWRKCSSARNKMSRQTVEGDQRQVPAEQQPAAAAVQDMTRLNPDSADPGMSLNSMPLIEIVEHDVDSCPLSRRCLPFTKNVRREMLVEQSEKPALCQQSVHKRGRHRKYWQSACLGMGDQTPTNKQTDSGEENCSQGRTPPLARSDDHNATQGKGSVRRKIAFKHRKTGQTAEQTAVGENATETTTAARRRGRPNKCDLVGKSQALSMCESTVCTDNEHSSSEKTAKYELIYFPTGMTSALDVTSCNTDWPRVKAQINMKSDTGMSQAVKQITSSKLRQTSDASPHRVAAGPTANIPYTKASRRRPASGATSWTLTEIVVNKEIGKPAVIQSQVVHKGDKRLSSQTPQKHELLTNVVPENSSATASRPHPVSATLEAHCVEGSNSSQPVKVLSQKDNENDLIHLRKERCKRRLEEGDRESVTQSVKRNRSVDREVKFLGSVASTQGKAGVLGDSPGISPQRRLVLGGSPGISPQRRLVLRKNVVPENDSAAASTPDSTAATVEANNSSGPIKVLNQKYSANDSIHRLKERCKRQLTEVDKESVTQFVKKYTTEEGEIMLVKPVSTAQQKTVVLKQPSVKTSQLKASALREPLINRPAQKASALREPSINRPAQKASALSQLSVKTSERTTVVLQHLLNGPSVKSQQKSEHSVESQRKTAVLRKLLSEPPAVTPLACVSPELVTQDESRHKVSETRIIKTASKDTLPPWTSKRHRSSRQTTGQQHHFSPKIRATKKVDPAEVHFRFL